MSNTSVCFYFNSKETNKEKIGQSIYNNKQNIMVQHKHNIIIYVMCKTLRLHGVLSRISLIKWVVILLYLVSKRLLKRSLHILNWLRTTFGLLGIEYFMILGQKWHTLLREELLLKFDCVCSKMILQSNTILQSMFYVIFWDLVCYEIFEKP